MAAWLWLRVWRFQGREGFGSQGAQVTFTFNRGTIIPRFTGVINPNATLLTTPVDKKEVYGA